MISEFEASLAYRVSSSAAMATQRKFVSKEKQTKGKKNVTSKNEKETDVERKTHLHILTTTSSQDFASCKGTPDDRRRGPGSGESFSHVNSHEFGKFVSLERSELQSCLSLGVH